MRTEVRQPAEQPAMPPAQRAAFDLDWTVEPDEAAEVAADAQALLSTITDEQRAILDFERTWWRNPGAKEQAIRDVFAVSPTRYYQTLNALLDAEEAVRYDPQLVHRLRRLRESRLRTRGGARPA
jgi:Protein of unknown function (DUF3263)